MIIKVGLFYRWLRRKFSRSEWLIRLLQLSRSHREETRPGLILIQIDGLSRRQLERALAKGRMPFLNQLLIRQHYKLHTHYSGVPSTTPSIQGELFYGVRQAVPSFSYFHQDFNRVVRMYDQEVVRAIESQLAEQGEPLLKNGSSYCNIYTGGAEESHFCGANWGISGVLQNAHPFAVIASIVLHAVSFLRTAALLVIETVLAFIDVVRGYIKGQDLWMELKFVFVRVGICVLMRDFITTSVQMDVARGRPIIHMNFIGYDEQAHRRGPTSRFAHWVLKGIDNSIKRIWRAASHSQLRHYDVWIYSDHGQETTASYVKIHGRTVKRAINHLFDHPEPFDEESTQELRGIQHQRIRLFDSQFLHKVLALPHLIVGEDDSPHPHVASMGPVGHVVPKQKLTDEQTERMARNMVYKAGIPLVMIKDGPGAVRAFTAQGEFKLPQQADEILPKTHRFSSDVQKELIDLVHHPHAGTFVISGWRATGAPLSFSDENGSHAGPGPNETRAFALLPMDIPLPESQKHYLRPEDIREAALRFLGRKPEVKVSAPALIVRPLSANHTLRVMTYNVHRCLGMDGKLLPQRIARVIARYRPDVVALQELDVRRHRTNRHDQAHMIANYLQMSHIFHPTVRIEEEQFGDAILSRFPISLQQAAMLPGISRKPYIEPRGALWVTLDFNGSPVQIVNTHFGLRFRERIAQADAIMGQNWLSHPDCREPSILLGDFNSLPGSQVCRKITSRLNDIQRQLENHRPQKTWLGHVPLTRIDHIFASSQFEVVKVEVGNSSLARLASDHLPLIAELRLKN